MRNGCGSRASSVVAFLGGTLLLAACSSPSVEHGLGQPGAEWLDADGRSSTIVEFSGSAHCEWQSATFIALGPLQQYVLDPEGVVPSTGRDFVGVEPLPIEMRLPADAEYTGFHHDERELWVSPAEGGDAIYIVSPEVTQRWPRNLAGCI
jgi:hypothetical protein